MARQRRGVGLQEHALLGIALSAAAMLRRASLSGTAYASLKQDTTDAGTGYGYTVSLGHHLGEMLGIEAAVGRLSQLSDALLHLGWDGVGWRLTSITVCQSCGTLLPICRQEPPHMA